MPRTPTIETALRIQAQVEVLEDVPRGVSRRRDESEDIFRTKIMRKRGLSREGPWRPDIDGRRRFLNAFNALARLLPRDDIPIQGWGPEITAAHDRLRWGLWGTRAFFPPNNDGPTTIDRFFEGRPDDVNDRDLAAKVSPWEDVGPFFDFVCRDPVHGVFVGAAQTFRRHLMPGILAGGAPSNGELTDDEKLSAFCTEHANRHDGDAPAREEMAAFLNCGRSALYHRMKAGRFPITMRLLDQFAIDRQAAFAFQADRAIKAGRPARLKMGAEFTANTDDK